MRAKVRSPFVSVLVGLAMAASLSFPGTAYSEIFKGYPDALICRGPGTRAVAYIAELKDNHSAIYKTLGQAYLTVTPDGVVHRQGAKDCDGKTLKQLEQNGQTRDFK